jgi:adenylosuccinate synthase
VVGVMKAFSTCVGVGPFVTEMQAEVADTLREVAFEYGAATGRPRRIGHFDAVASRFGAYVQGATEIALTKLDCLSGLPSLKICTAYRIRGESTTTFPLNSLLDEAEPVYLEMPGWTGDITACRRFDDLPSAAREYVRTIERLVGTRIRFVSVGPERSQMIETV